MGVRGTMAARRGAVVLVLVVVIAVINIALIGGVTASGDDAQTGALRVETIRAFYAAESGGFIAAKGLSGDTAVPAEGSQVAVGSQSIHFIEVREPSGEVVVEGRAGFARRRLDLQIE